MKNSIDAEVDLNMQPPEGGEDLSDAWEGRSPDFVIKQYRPVKTRNGTKTRKETIGSIWQDAASGKLTIGFNGVQVITNTLHAYPTFEFKS